MNLSVIGKLRLRTALATAIATAGLLAAVMAPATGVNEDWPAGAIIEAPGEFELPPPEPDPFPGPSASPQPGSDEGIARYVVVSVEIWEISPPPDPTPTPSMPAPPTQPTPPGPSATVALQRVAVLQQVRCNTVAVSASGLNLFRATLWTYRMEVDWCWNGARVTNTAGPRISGSVAGWAAALGWDYQGVRNMNGPADRFGNNWTYRTYSQGAFAYSPPPKVWTIQRAYPQLWIDVSGNGGSRTWAA